MTRVAAVGLVVASIWGASFVDERARAQEAPDAAHTPDAKSGDQMKRAAITEHPPTQTTDGSVLLSSCNDFDLLTPLYGISSRGPDRSNPNHRDSLRVTGPVASGIGAGYYHTLHGLDTCKPKWSIDWEVFGFSEGLDPSTTFQVGIGGGLALTVFGKFQFGLALGYDLVRFEHIESNGVKRSYTNGLLVWNDVLGCGTSRGGPDAARCAGRNFTWLLTFGLTASSSAGAGSGSSSAPAPTPGPSNGSDTGSNVGSGSNAGSG